MDSQKPAPHCIIHRISGQNISGLKILQDAASERIKSAKGVRVYRGTDRSYIVGSIHSDIFIKNNDQALKKNHRCQEQKHHGVLFPYCFCFHSHSLSRSAIHMPVPSYAKKSPKHSYSHDHGPYACCST